MNVALRAPLGLFEYLDFEAKSPLKHEYVGGAVYAMTGGTTRHNRITLNIAAALMGRLKGTPCDVFVNDVKLHVAAADAVDYPVLVVEVASDSSAQTDAREKRAANLQLPGLHDYWIVQQSSMTVEAWLPDEQGKISVERAGRPDDNLSVPTLGTAPIAPIALADIYTGTDIA